MAKKTLPPMYSSWRQFYDDIITKHPEVQKHRKIVLQWMNPSDMATTSDYVKTYRFSIYINTLKKKCFEESMGKL